jgi:hypothetical protein|tara:strand:+ start:1925 stop:2227 length:303 start_codon:yes stop_codon:yes gene_type:complete
MIDWEKQPNGKWKVKKPVGFVDYGWHSPWWKKAQKKMARIIKNCDVCGDYTLLEPCIHHLADDYKSTKRRQEYWKELKKRISKTVEKNTTQQTVIKGESI